MRFFLLRVNTYIVPIGLSQHHKDSKKSRTFAAGVWYQASIVNTRCGHAAMLVRTFPFLSPDWDDIVSYKGLNKYVEERNDPAKRNYILVDEVQEIKVFEKSVRHWRTEPRTDLVLTGSNAETLSSDLSTLQAARYHEIHIQALTYKDFIRFHKLEEGDEALSLYINSGGLPGLVKCQLPTNEFVGL